MYLVCKLQRIAKRYKVYYWDYYFLVGWLGFNFQKQS